MYIIKKKKNLIEVYNSLYFAGQTVITKVYDLYNCKVENFIKLNCQPTTGINIHVE